MLFSIQTKAQVAEQIRVHVEKLLLSQLPDGMIPSGISFEKGVLQKNKDIPRQAFLTMALMQAALLLPALPLFKKIELSKTFIENNLEGESESDKLYTYLYLALAHAHTDKVALYVKAIQNHLSQEIFKHPIAIGLYIRLSNMLSKELPFVTYIKEVQRYNLALIPRKYRFFDYADTLVWGKQNDAVLAENEYRYLRDHMTHEGWIVDVRTGMRASASATGKVFEVFAYYEAPEADILYAALMSQTAQSQYAQNCLMEYSGHILSHPHALQIDDVHGHILIGLCYKYQILSCHEK